VAMKKQAEPPAWASPVWPDRLPDPAAMRLVYGSKADELVIRFSADRRGQTVVVPVTTPDHDYAGLLVSADTGAVVGVHVYPLAAFAVRRHPDWRAATEPNPPLEVASRIVNDIRALFDRYGIDDSEPD